MLYVIGRALSILFIFLLNIAVNIVWFNISVVIGVAIVLATLFLIYKTVVFTLQEKKQRALPRYDILQNLN